MGKGLDDFQNIYPKSFYIKDIILNGGENVMFLCSWLIGNWMMGVWMGTLRGKARTS
jgi:hypothetical protein